MNSYCWIKHRVKIVSLLRLQKNFPLKFVLSRCVILKAYETESKQGNNRGKIPFASLVIQAVSIPWRVSRKTTLHMSSVGKYNRKSYLYCSEETPMYHWLSICYRFWGNTTLERSLTISSAIFISKHHLLQRIDEEANEQVV